MTSRIIVNNIQSDTGVSTVTIASPVALSGGITGGGFAVGTGASISSPATNVLTVSTNNVERIRVGAAGSIGIGTDNPTKLIDMSGVHSGINTTGRFVMSPHASGWDTGVTSGNIHHHYIDNFRIYSGQIGSGTERFNVDSSGRVTKPFHPFVGVTKTNGNPTGTDTLIIFNTVDVNIGSHYSTSTGLFTCPVAGSYRITIHGHTENSSGNHGLSPLKNGVLQNGGSYSGFVSATWVSHISDTIISCAVNDTLSARNRYGTFWGGNSEGVTMTIQLLG